MTKDINELTSDEKGCLLHTISVECSYWQFKDAQEHDAISFTARTSGEWEGVKIDDLDYGIQCSIEEAREFARYILSLCDQIELAKQVMK